jgi:hypothetical protein
LAFRLRKTFKKIACAGECPKRKADQRADLQSRASAGRYLKEVFSGE